MQRESKILTWMLNVALRHESDQCLLYPFCTTDDGYGRLRIGHVRVQAHHFVCEATYGPQPLGKQAAHGCGVRRCVNKRHLRWATPLENCADREAHGTTARGERMGPAKLTTDQVLAIRTDAQSHRKIAAKYGVSHTAVGSIKRRVWWSWL